MSQNQRVLVVSNRLPITAAREGGEWSLKSSSGGLVSALAGGLQGCDWLWIGWPGVHVEDQQEQKSLTEALAKKAYIPVFLDEKMINGYYNGYCNTTLWSLLHSFDLPPQDSLAAAKEFESQFDIYKEVNQIFAKVVNQHYEEGDVVWCQDYHLMYLPRSLRKRNSEMLIGWFLHTAFPSWESYSALPSRKQLLQGVLASNVVGFHTTDYADNFKTTCIRILKCKDRTEGLTDDQGNFTRVVVSPVGISPDRFTRELETCEFQNALSRVKETMRGCKIILGIDRLDPIKGIPHKILAYEKLLDDHPEWISNVLFFQLLIPSRSHVPQYIEYGNQIKISMGEVIGRFARLSWNPIILRDNALSFTDMCAMLAAADVALVTSVRDGMNLVSFEYIACQSKNNGVLILSEFAGAAEHLGNGAILVNPHSVTKVAKAINKALTMPEEERKRRQELNLKYVTSKTADRWVNKFVRKIMKARKRKADVTFEAEKKKKRKA